jgi:hypothetical protein
LKPAGDDSPNKLHQNKIGKSKVQSFILRTQVISSSFQCLNYMYAVMNVSDQGIILAGVKTTGTAVSQESQWESPKKEQDQSFFMVKAAKKLQQVFLNTFQNTAMFPTRGCNACFVLIFQSCQLDYFSL